jgi:hypothetical protein
MKTSKSEIVYLVSPLYGIDSKRATVALSTKAHSELSSLKGVVSDIVPKDSQDVLIVPKNRAWMYARVWLGHHHGPCPQGYQVVKDINGRSIIMPDQNFQFMGRMFTIYARGEYTDREIVNLLNIYGFRTKNGRKMTLSKMRRLLRNPMYIGRVKDLRKDCSQYYEGRWPAAIDSKTFREVQHMLKRRGHRYCDVYA